MVSTTNIYFSQFWRLKTKVKVLVDLVSGAVCFLACRCVPYIRRADGVRANHHSLFYSIVWALSSWPNYFPESSPPNAITLGTRISKYEFGGHGCKYLVHNTVFLICYWVRIIEHRSTYLEVISSFFGQFWCKKKKKGHFGSGICQGHSSSSINFQNHSWCWNLGRLNDLMCIHLGTCQATLYSKRDEKFIQNNLP